MYLTLCVHNAIKNASWKSKVLEVIIKLLLPECKDGNILGEDFLAGEEEVLNEKPWNFICGHPKQVTQLISVRPLGYKLF